MNKNTAKVWKNSKNKKVDKETEKGREQYINIL